MIDRIKRPVARANINLDEVGSLPIILPPTEMRNKAVDIFKESLEQKKQNEAKAQQLLAGIDDYLLKELGITLPMVVENSLKNRIFRVSIRKISGNRFDTPYYQHNWYLTSNKFPMTYLKNVTEINPVTHFLGLKNSDEVSFIPMESVSEEGYISNYGKNQISNSKGYTCFKENDLLVAKITPCMENGKTAIAKSLFNGFGFGSTEFHIFRAIDTERLSIDYLHFLFRTKYFRSISKLQYGGSAGHQRVPPTFFHKLLIPVPPLPKQKEIAEHITAIRQQAQQLKDKTKSALEQASKEIEEILLGS